jgi:hypothetical protein
MARGNNSTNAKVAANVVDFIEALRHPHKAAIKELREFILSLDSRIKEEVKCTKLLYRIQFRDTPSSSNSNPSTRSSQWLQEESQPKEI